MTRAKGFDTSKWNHYVTGSNTWHPIDWQAVFDAGYDFVFQRIVDGTIIDPDFISDWQGAGQTPLIQVVYQTLYPAISVARHLEALKAALIKVNHSPRYIAIDVEVGATGSGDYNAPAIKAAFRGWCDAVRNQWPGIKIILYTSLWYLSLLDNDEYGCDVWLSWPGEKNGMNPKEDPPIDDWVCYQRSYKQEIPGIARKDNDYDEWNGTTEDLFVYFGIADGGEQPPAEGEVIDYRPQLIALVLALQGIETQTKRIADMLDDYDLTPPVDPGDGGTEPEPTEPELITLRVRPDGDKAKANARCVKGYNNAGAPIMQIYPTDISAVSERVQFADGAIVKAYPDKVKADGGGNYYMLYEAEHTLLVDLYLRQEDVTKEA